MNTDVPERYLDTRAQLAHDVGYYRQTAAHQAECIKTLKSLLTVQETEIVRLKGELDLKDAQITRLEVEASRW